jgi:hypothetical protein
MPLPHFSTHARTFFSFGGGRGATGWGLLLSLPSFPLSLPSLGSFSLSPLSLFSFFSCARSHRAPVSSASHCALAVSCPVLR